MTEVAASLVIVECAEHDSIEIDAALWLNSDHQLVLNSEIDGRDILRANFRKGVLRLQVTSYVGVIPLNDRVLVRVKPRVPIANLTRMVIETGHDVLALSAFREYSSRGTADDWAMDVYADALLDYLDELLDAGMMRSYERREDEGRFPHGRIDFTQTMQRFAARGVPNKAAYSWFGRTVDTPANRCIKAALEVAHAYLTKSRAKPRKGDRAKIARLAGQMLAFAEVSDDSAYLFLDDPVVLGLTPLPDSRAYYRQALDLSVVILRNTGIALEIGGADVRLSSLLVDTNKLFEKFVRVSLAKHAARHSWPVEVLDGNTEGRVDLYDVPDPLPSPLGTPMQALASVDPGKAQPDVVLRGLDGTICLIAEVKNTVHGKNAKAEDVLPERDEVEQAVTYALRYGLNFTVLIHPWFKGAKGLVYVGRVGSVDVYDYRLDLSTNYGIDEALADMAATLAGLAGIPAGQPPTSA
ncbi:5-methylcytosine restriction system specificity protein McrC [Micromonospora zamorensis]|uniref:5-methylcytosine restriction system specificity protein McrC n=1 Tax=Micromonospora zamorensis TaxID=709883 RepID=UPI003CEA1322